MDPTTRTPYSVCLVFATVLSCICVMDDAIQRRTVHNERDWIFVGLWVIITVANARLPQSS
ncbi:hypothetical protein V8F44DRAFT_614419 [Aspergillus fumigatus]